MTEFNRRSLLKAGVTAGLAMCGGRAGLARAESTAAPGSTPGAVGGGEFGLQFIGLFLCAYSKTKKRAIIALPTAAAGHEAYLAADLRHVDGAKSGGYDAVVAGPGGQQMGIWKFKAKGGIVLEDVTGATIAPTATTDVTKCPESDPSVWQSISWLADVRKIQDSAVTLDESKLETFLTLTHGVFGAVMPSNPDALDQNFVVVDDQNKDVEKNGNQIIDQPLASAMFYRGTMLSDRATLTLPDGTTISFKGLSSGGFQAYLSNLPKAFSTTKPQRQLEHFAHYYGLLTGATKKQYPGIGNKCGMALGTRSSDARGGVPSIEPIFCPPSLLFED